MEVSQHLMRTLKNNNSNNKINTPDLHIVQPDIGKEAQADMLMIHTVTK